MLTFLLFTLQMFVYKSMAVFGVILILLSVFGTEVFKYVFRSQINSLPR